MTAVARIQAVYREGRGSWSGCNWPTRFGTLGIDLDGMTAAVARRVASRWSGLNTSDNPTDHEWACHGRLAACLDLPPCQFAWEWGLAAAVLAAIEQDARSAASQAREAYRAARERDWPRALLHARRAAAIEAGYHAPRGWRKLWRVIRRAAALYGAG